MVLEECDARRCIVVGKKCLGVGCFQRKPEGERERTGRGLLGIGERFQTPEGVVGLLGAEEEQEGGNLVYRFVCGVFKRRK